MRGDIRYAKDDTNLKDSNVATRTAKKTAAPAKRRIAKQAIVPAKTPRKATPNATKAKPETGKKLSQIAAAI